MLKLKLFHGYKKMEKWLKSRSCDFDSVPVWTALPLNYIEVFPGSSIKIPHCYQPMRRLNTNAMSVMFTGHEIDSNQSDNLVDWIHIFLHCCWLYKPIQHTQKCSITYFFMWSLNIKLFKVWHWNWAPLNSNNNISRDRLTDLIVWLLIMRSQVRLPALLHFSMWIKSGSGSTRPHEENWATTWLRSN